MLRIINTLKLNWEYSFVLPYIMLCLKFWKMRESIIALIPITPTDIPFYEAYYKACEILFILLSMIGLLGIISLINAPIHLKIKFNKAFRQIGLHNEQMQYPIVKKVYRDKHKYHGSIFELYSPGLSVVEFDKKTTQLQTTTGYKIYQIVPNIKPSRIQLYAMPHKYVKPLTISLNDNYLSDLINCLVVGSTGSGKSYALSVLLGIYAKYIPDVSITLCDFKKSSFSQFEDCPNFYGYEDVPNGIRTFYKEFQERLIANDSERNKKIQILVIDEYGALISSRTKKEADELKTMVGNMLFMSRSLGMKILIGVQRADSEHFKSGARDQFKSILALGNLSKEQKNMLFADYKDKMTERNGLGEGYLLIDGKDIERVKVSEIKSFDNLNNIIREAMYR